MIKNSQLFGIKFQKTAGGDFLTHNVECAADHFGLGLTYPSTDGLTDEQTDGQTDGLQRLMPSFGRVA